MDVESVLAPKGAAPSEAVRDRIVASRLRQMHRGFLKAPPDVLSALRSYLRTRKRSAWGVVQRYAVNMPAEERGRVRIEREEWRADTSGHVAIPEGARVIVERVSGTHLVVRPVDGPLEERE